MAKDTDYEMIVVESFIPSRQSGLHGKVHIRPVEGQGYDPGLHVECSKRLSKEFPVGTKFRIRAKLTDREDGGEYLYSSWRWAFEVVERKNSN